MKQFFFIVLCCPVLIFGQTIFSNPINGVNPNTANPYTAGQFFEPNITVSGIGRGSGIFGINANNRYDARSWKTTELDSNAYFEFIISPNSGKKIDYVSFVYTGQISANGPVLFAFRSSADGFASDIGMVSATGATVSLLSSTFQNVESAITFRLYAWGASTGTGTFSINDFEFNGVVSCAIPKAPLVAEINLPCSATSFDANWSDSFDATDYFIDVATDSDFVNYLEGYQNKELGNVFNESVSGFSAGGSYYVRLRSANSCGISANSNSIKVAPPETIYNGIWSNGTPDITKNVHFASDFNIDSNLEACSCQIDSGVAVHVNPDVVLKLENELHVLGTATLTFENNASLIQTNDAAVNIGKIIYRRVSSPMKNFDFTYWSAPVKDQVLNVLSPNTLYDKYFSYANNNWVTENGTNTMNPAGKGFIIRVPKPFSYYPNGKDYWSTTTYAQPVEFIGIPNNGIVRIPVQSSQYNLIGNPYPSAINADLVMKRNAAVLSGALYFWTHNTAIAASGNQFVYSSNDYATYTLTGGTKAGSGGVVPSGKIAAGQSFFERSETTGDFEFNNSMRSVGPNSQFFKITNTKSDTKEEKNRVWLNLTNAGGAFKQLLLGYIAGATNDFDNLYDGVSLNGNTYVDFYSINGSKNLTIQGRALPFNPTDQVSLGYKTNIEGSFSISIDNVDGVLTGQTIYIEDKVTNVIHNLKDGAYAFNTLKGEFKDRFILRYKLSSEEVLKKDDFENSDQQFQIVVQENQLELRSESENVSKVFIYDLKGTLLYQKRDIDEEQIIISMSIPKHQMLIVKTVFSNNSSRTDKIIF